MKKLTVMLLVMTLVFGLAACGNASEKGSNVTETQAQSAEDTGAGNAELNKLYEKENAIIAKHQELWNTVFNNIDKNKAADAGEQNYGTFLETQLDHVKDQFSEADLKKLDKDIEEIKKIEDQVTELTAQMGTENSGAQSANAETSVFPSFQAKDLDGNKVDSSIFSQNAVTVVNFWFNGCTPCVEELPALNKLNEELKAKGGQVIGVNTDSLDGNKEGIAEAKSILKKQGADYTNLSLDSDSEAGKYATNIMAFPTTVLVDRNGNIVGDPILFCILEGIQIPDEKLDLIRERLEAEKGKGNEAHNTKVYYYYLILNNADVTISEADKEYILSQYRYLKSEQTYDLAVDFLKLISELNVMSNDEITEEYKDISESVGASYNLLELQQKLNMQPDFTQDSLSQKVNLANKCLIKDDAGVMYISTIYSDIMSTQSENIGVKFS